MKTGIKEVRIVRTKEPVQKRSRETRRKILEAARRLFTDNGFDEATTHLIAEGAGISVGGLYAHFPNKEEIFLTLLEERSQEAYQVTKKTIDEILERGLSLAEGFDYLVPAWYEIHMRHGKLNLEMAKFISMNEEASRIHDHWEQEEVREVRRWMKLRSEEVSVEDPESAGLVMACSIHQVFHFLYKNQGRVDDQKILASLTKMLKRFMAE